MRHQSSFRYVVVLLALALSACSNDDVFTGTGDGLTPVQTSVASVQLLSDKSRLRTGDETADQGVTVSAIVRDADGVLLPSVPVSFSTREVASTATNGICTQDPNPQNSGGALQVVNALAVAPGAALTSEAGLAQAILTTGGDDRNRCVEVIATASGQQDSLFIPIVGTQLSVTGPNVVATGANATYTANLTDGNGLGIPNRVVTVSTENGNGNPVSNPNSPDEGTPTATVVTNEAGAADFVLTGLVGGTEQVTVSAFNLSQTLGVAVSSVSISIAADPNDADCDTEPASSLLEIGLGRSCSIVVTLTDTSNPANVANRSVTLLSTRGTVSPATATSDANGVAVFQVSAAQSNGAGPAILQAAAEVSASQTAETSLAVEFVATQPAVIEVQAEPGTVQVNDSAVIRAIVRDSQNNLVKNQIVDFSINDNTSGSLSAASKVTNSQGVAQVTFNASNTPSAANGVRITARVRGSSPVVTNTVALTVGGSALRVTFGTGNEIIDDNTVYRKDFSLIITDAEGNPPPNDTTFRLAIRTLGYQKGQYVLNVDNKWVAVYAIEEPDRQGFPLENGNEIVFGCAREDLNFNGILDPGEDDPTVAITVNGRPYAFGNNSGVLEPGNVATILIEEADDEAASAEPGITQFQIVYPQQYANWVLVELRAVASVAGTETLEVQRFVLPVSAQDTASPDVSPPGNPSPFGESGTCDIEG